MKKENFRLILAMLIFGTIGLVRRYIPYSSTLVAAFRGICASIYLLVLHFIRREKFDRVNLKRNFWLLLLSGVTMGFNWILLFEAYNYTTVSVATICYYMAPVIVILLSPILLREKMTLQKSICALLAVVGMVFVSGVLHDGLTGVKGIMLGLASAVLYAAVMLINKKINGVSATERTLFQLVFASAALLPYLFLTENVAEVSWELTPVLLLFLVGIFHTGFAYSLYFSSFQKVSVQAVAIFSYIDPVVAVLLSALVLHEPLDVLARIGVVLVILGTMASDLDFKKK